MVASHPHPQHHTPTHRRQLYQEQLLVAATICIILLMTLRAVRDKINEIKLQFIFGYSTKPHGQIWP